MVRLFVYFESNKIKETNSHCLSDDTKAPGRLDATSGLVRRLSKKLDRASDDYSPLLGPVLGTVVGLSLVPSGSIAARYGKDARDLGSADEVVGSDFMGGRGRE